MGRPPKAAEEKRQQVNIRLSPADKAALAELADNSGRPIAAEAELIITQHLESLRTQDSETRALLNVIAKRIADIQRQTKQRWHKALTTWAAVSEMLGLVAEYARPDQPTDDEFVDAAWSKYYDMLVQRRHTIAKLAAFGVTASEQPRRRNSNALLGIFGRSWDLRASERRMIDDNPNAAERDLLNQLFDQLLEHDKQVEAAEEAWADLMQPYWAAERAGRQLAKDYLRSEAERAQQAGQPYVAKYTIL